MTGGGCRSLGCKARPRVCRWCCRRRRPVGAPPTCGLPSGAPIWEPQGPVSRGCAAYPVPAAWGAWPQAARATTAHKGVLPVLLLCMSPLSESALCVFVCLRVRVRVCVVGNAPCPSIARPPLPVCPGRTPSSPCLPRDLETYLDALNDDEVPLEDAGCWYMWSKGHMAAGGSTWRRRHCESLFTTTHVVAKCLTLPLATPPPPCRHPHPSPCFTVMKPSHPFVTIWELLMLFPMYGPSPFRTHPSRAQCPGSDCRNSEVDMRAFIS